MIFKMQCLLSITGAGKWHRRSPGHGTSFHLSLARGSTCPVCAATTSTGSARKDRHFQRVSTVLAFKISSCNQAFFMNTKKRFWNIPYTHRLHKCATRYLKTIKCCKLLQVLQNKVINRWNRWNIKAIAQWVALLFICLPCTTSSASQDLCSIETGRAHTISLGQPD
jgi:hypothetical protein